MFRGFFTRKQFCNISVCHYRWSSAFGTATALRAGRTRVRIRVRAVEFCLHQHVQTGSGANPASYLMGTAVLLPGLSDRDINVRVSGRTAVFPSWREQGKLYHFVWNRIDHVIIILRYLQVWCMLPSNKFPCQWHVTGFEIASCMWTYLTV